MFLHPPTPLESQMMLLGCGPSGAGGGVVYERTAFVSSGGNDGTAALNDAALPYLTQDAAVDALATAYPGQTTTLRYQSNLTTDLNLSANLNTLLGIGLTLRAHDATARTLSGAISFGSAAGSLLALSKVIITVLAKDAHVGSVTESAGTITGDADTTIATLLLDGAVGSVGVAGITGGTVTGAAGNTGADGDPPENGTDGESADASGSSGGAGGAGGNAWNVTLEGSGLLSSVIGRGANGRIGGTGGIGGAATGGNGGSGGSSTAIILQDGGNGGNGGSATSNGGNAGDSGNGGNGSTIIKAAGWTITTNELTAGVGPAGSTNNGMGGSASGGTGSSGGSGAAGGASGASGSNGSAASFGGNAGAAGSDGAAGSII